MKGIGSQATRWVGVGGIEWGVVGRVCECCHMLCGFVTGTTGTPGNEMCGSESPLDRCVGDIVPEVGVMEAVAEIIADTEEEEVGAGAITVGECDARGGIVSEALSCGDSCGGTPGYGEAPGV